jgi:glucose/arabinose dehydrogenase
VPPSTSALSVVLLVLLGCSAGPEAAQSPPPVAQASSPTARPLTRAVEAQPQVTGEIARDLAVPWGLDFLPGGDALVTERDSRRVLRVTPDGVVTPVGEVPAATDAAEGGLLGLAVSPGFASDRLVYLYYSTATDNRIARATYDESAGLGPLEPLVTGIPSATFHDGGRIEFGPDGMLYAGTGDATRRALAQDPASLAGKVLRMTPDGAPAPGNPIPGSLVYSLGHRNVQGLAFDTQGRLWISEYGANAWDELNLVRPGGNYGWPQVEGRGGDARFIDPVVQWPVEEASPSGIVIVDGVVYMAALRGERLWTVPVQGDAAAGEPRAHLDGEYGRLRSIAEAPDGTLWLTTSNRDGRGDPGEGDDRILRVALLSN